MYSVLYQENFQKLKKAFFILHVACWWNVLETKERKGEEFYIASDCIQKLTERNIHLVLTQTVKGCVANYIVDVKIEQEVNGD